MPSPSFRSSSREYNLLSTTTFTAFEPAGAALNDGLIFVVLLDNEGGGHGAVTTPTGWTFEGSHDTYDSLYSIYIYSIRRGASAPSYTLNWANPLGGDIYYEWYVLAYTGVVSTGSIVEQVVWSASSNSGTVDPPSVTTGVVSTAIIAGLTTWAGITTATPPTGYTQHAGGGNYDMAFSSKALVLTGTENPSAVTIDNGAQTQIGFTLVLKASNSAFGDYSFDGVAKVITLNTANLSVLDLFSRWKDWLLLGNTMYPQAFASVGGDPIDVANGVYITSYIFLQNGWRIRPMESTHSLTVTGGVLLVEGGGVPFIPTIGAYNVMIQYSQPIRTETVATGGGGDGFTATDRTKLTETRALAGLIPAAL